MKHSASALLLASLLLTGCSTLRDGTYHLHVISTNDIHGHWLDSTFTRNQVRGSLVRASTAIEEIRNREGRDHVVLIDAGDALQGTSAAFYYNFVDTTGAHLYPRIAAYMGYDAVVAGAGDLAAGNGVRTRVNRELKRNGIPLLAGNLLRTADGKYVLSGSRTFRRGGLKIAVLGYSDADLSAQVDSRLLEGMQVEPFLPLIQQDVDRIRKKERPHVVIVAVHSGIGKGKGNDPRNQASNLYNQLQGVDFVIAGADHKAVAVSNGEKALMEAGSYARDLAVGRIELQVKQKKVISKSVQAERRSLSGVKADAGMDAFLSEAYAAVGAFCRSRLGELTEALPARAAYAGSSPYMNLYHSLALSVPGVDIAMSAPLSIDGILAPGDLSYNDLARLYPFDNSLIVISMTGQEIRKYLEASYDNWIQTPGEEGGSVLRIKTTKDPRTGAPKFNFAKSPANFDAAGGLCYTVDVTRPAGERVAIRSMADGTPFRDEDTYGVGITSYRASGAGMLLQAAGIDPKDLSGRIRLQAGEFRKLLYLYIKEHGGLSPAVFSDKTVVGEWHFVPEAMTSDAVRNDLGKLFGPPTTAR